MSLANLAKNPEELKELRAMLVRRINEKARELAALEAELDAVDRKLEATSAQA